MRIMDLARIKLFLRIITLTIALSFVLAPRVSSTSSELQVPAAPSQEDLTGAWLSDLSGTYYIRQIGNQVFWLGQSQDGGVSYTNVFRGIRNANTIMGFWGDVPAGKNLGSGSITLSISRAGDTIELRKVRETGGFGESLWRKSANTPRPTPKSSPEAQYSILPDGRVKKKEPNGWTRIYGESSVTVIFPDGRQETQMYANVQAATPPMSTLTPTITTWLNAQNNRVLGAIEELLAPGERSASMDNLKSKQAGIQSPYEKLSFSTGALSILRR